MDKIATFVCTWTPRETGSETEEMEEALFYFRLFWLQHPPPLPKTATSLPPFKYVRSELQVQPAYTPLYDVRAGVGAK
jgi:hypothetical protein